MARRIIFKVAGWVLVIGVVYLILSKTGLIVYAYSLVRLVKKTHIISTFIGYLRDAIQNLLPG